MTSCVRRLTKMNAEAIKSTAAAIENTEQKLEEFKIQWETLSNACDHHIDKNGFTCLYNKRYGQCWPSVCPLRDGGLS